MIRDAAPRAMERVADPAVWATRSTMIAAATLMIAAESLGVASAPMEGFVAAKVREAFGVPDDHTVYCLVALGYAAESKPFPGRLKLGDVCYEEHFGQPWTLGEDGGPPPPPTPPAARSPRRRPGPSLGSVGSSSSVLCSGVLRSPMASHDRDGRAQ